MQAVTVNLACCDAASRALGGKVCDWHQHSSIGVLVVAAHEFACWHRGQVSAV